MFNGDARLVFVKSGFTNGGSRPSIDDYGKALNLIRARSVKESEERGHNVYGTPEFVAQRKMLNSFKLIQGERGRREKVLVERVLFLFCLSVKGEKDEDGPFFAVRGRRGLFG